MPITQAAVARSRKRLLAAWFKRTHRTLPRGFAAWTPTFGSSAVTAMRIANKALLPALDPDRWTAALTRKLQTDSVAPGPAALKVASFFLGPIETEGNNRGPMVRRVQASTDLAPGPWPYCAAGVYYCLRQAGWVHATAFRTSTLEAWVPAWVSAARARQHGLKVIAQADAAPGDLVCFDWNGVGGTNTNFDHIGFVRGKPTGGAVGGVLPTREFNTGPGAGGNQSDGDGCWDRLRPVNPGVLIIRVS
jgi:hypothetical protein